jgi:hypothetical protein
VPRPARADRSAALLHPVRAQARGPGAAGWVDGPVRELRPGRGGRVPRHVPVNLIARRTGRRGVRRPARRSAVAFRALSDRSGVRTSVATSRRVIVILQVAVRMPSSSSVPDRAPGPGGSGTRSPPAINRVRSACESSRLSYSGKNRGGAGVSGSGRGAPGRSSSSAPCSSRKTRKRGRSRSATSASRVSPDQVCTSLTVAGPKAARYRSTTASSEGRSASGWPSQASTVVQRAAPLRPHTPRGVTWTTGTRYVIAWANDAESTSGQASASAAPSSGRVDGRTDRNSRPASSSVAVSAPEISNGAPAKLRSSTGCTTGRRLRQSRALTRWMVARIRGARTASRETISSDSCSGRKSSSRVHRPT